MKKIETLRIDGLKELLNLIDSKEETFIINGEKIFIYGGELHYFRVPKKDWEDRIKKIKEAGCNLISTYIPWMWHEVKEGEIDLIGESTPERDLVYFLKKVEEQGMYCLVRPGPYVMSEIKNHGIPYWINEKYPEVIAKKQNGEMHTTGVVSYLHSIFLEKVENWYKAICKVIAPMQITEGKNVIMFQLDNEVGMLQWVTNQADYNEDTLKKFVCYIKSKYTLDKLNILLKTNLKKYEDVIKLIKEPKEYCNIKIQNEFMLFMRMYYKKYIETLKAIAVKYGIKIPFVINVHGFDSNDYAKRGLKYPIGLSQLYEASKINEIITAGDYYIGNIVHENYHDIVLANAFTKAIQNEKQPLFSAEFQGGFQYDIPRLQPTTFDLTTRLCIANGMNSLNYYMFAGGENYENIGILGKRHDWQAPISSDGSLKKHYYIIQYLGNVIKSIEKELLESKKDIVTYIGFYVDYYMTEYSNKYTQKMNDRLKIFRESFLYDGVGKGLTLNNITYEGYDVKRDKKINVKKIKSLWMFSSYWMDEDIQEKLIEYVKEGGKLILYPSVPTMNMKGEPCTKLIEALNIEVGESFFGKYVNLEDIDSVLADYVEIYKGKDIKSFAYLQDDNQKVCAFEKNIEKGKIIVLGIGFKLDHHFKNEIILKLAEKIDNYPVTKRNDYIDVSFRSISGKNTKFMFIQNYDEYKKTMAFDYFGEILFDGHEITINPRSGLLLPINYKINENIELIYSTCELVLNDKNKIEVFCKQNIEIMKFSKKVQVETQNIDYKLINENEKYKLILKNCLHKNIKITF